MADTKFDLSEEQIEELVNQKSAEELKTKIESSHLWFKRIAFGIFLILIVILFIASFYFAYQFVFIHEQEYAQNIVKFCNENNISMKTTKIYSNMPSSILVGTMLMIPTILALAMMRFIFGSKDEQKDKNIPSIMFNIGVELKEVLLALIKKR